MAVVLPVVRMWVVRGAVRGGLKEGSLAALIYGYEVCILETPFRDHTRAAVGVARARVSVAVRRGVSVAVGSGWVVALGKEGAMAVGRGVLDMGNLGRWIGMVTCCCCHELLALLAVEMV